MPSPTRALLAMLFIGSSFGVAHAQAPLTNAQLVAKVTALEQEVARLQRLADVCMPPTPTIIAPAGHQQTLGEAAAEAARVKHEWAVSGNIVPTFDATLAAARTPVVNAVSAAGTEPPAIAASPQDETTWRNRARTLKTALDNDRTFHAAAVLRERALDQRLHKNADDALYIRDRLERATVDGQWQDSVAEMSRLKALVTNDTRAIGDLELEAKRANVPPGWLVIQ